MTYNKNYKIGLRGVKTAIAVCLCAIIAIIFKHQDIFCACVASVICMEQTCEKTLDTGINRFIGTLVGGIVGYIALEICHISRHYDTIRILALPLCILIVVYICNFINRKLSVSIGCVVVICILARIKYSSSNNLMYVIERVCDTLIGIFIAMIINKIDFKKLKFKVRDKL